jgi:NitT/TauT family transport system substrate-binding protein
MKRKLALETTAPFQGLPELVAYDEGLFEAEGLEIEWVDRDKGALKTIEVGVNTPDGLSAHGSHGAAFETGDADMYNACEWGNYRRVQDTSVKGRQIGRRAIIVYAGLVVPPDSDVYTPQQLANKLIGIPYYFGTHYLALLMLEGFLPRDVIKTCHAPNSSAKRYDSIRKGEIAATTLTEPYLTLAEKEGCRVIVLAPYHGTEVASEEIDAETYAAFNRAVGEAVRRINADKRKYLRYFLDHHKGQHPGLAALTIDDFPVSRLQVVEPSPIPEEELRRTYDWMQSWQMLDPDFDADNLVAANRQKQAHVALGE